MTPEKKPIKYWKRLPEGKEKIWIHIIRGFALCQENEIPTINGRCKMKSKVTIKVISKTWMMLLLFSWGNLTAQDFQFSYKEGEQYRYVGNNEQKVVLNGEVTQNTTILSRVTFQVLKTQEKKGFIRGNIQFIQSTDTLDGPVHQLVQEYPTEFWRDARGLYDISPAYLVPIVRNVPRFPDREIKPGDTWVFPGEEVHDMKADFGLEVPLRVPMTVYYKYLGDKTLDGKVFKEITVSYDIFARTSYTRGPKGYYPVRMSGSSRQVLLWDLEAGRPQSYEEEYALYIYLNTGDAFEFSGKADSQLVEAPLLDRDQTVLDLQKNLLDRGYNQAQVRPVERGVTISLDDIRFEANTDRMLPGEESKLDVIAEILTQYAGRDVLVEGHTALAGTPEERMSLSENRAKKVLEYFLRRGIRSPQQMTYRGWGSDKPIAPNTTEEGRQKNRRVEITILEN